MALVSPFLMEASLIEVRAGTKGYLLVYRPDEWWAAIFTVYNRKVAEHALLFPIFHCFETAFRSTVAVRLEQHYQHARWWRHIHQQMRNGVDPKTIATINNVQVGKRIPFLIGHIIRSIDGNCFQKNIVGGLQNGYEFLEFCTLSQVRQLVEEHWPVFATVRSEKAAPHNGRFYDQVTG